MKSEERHELETNSLAKLINEAGEKVGPYASHIIYGLLAIAAIWAVVKLSAGKISADELTAWDSYTVATLPGKYDSAALEGAAQQHSGDLIGELAQIAYADGLLADGCRVYFANKKQAVASLDDALEAYQALAKSASDNGLKGRAQLGVAKTLEAKGEIKQAIDAYQEVTGPFSEMADSRAEQLEEFDAPAYASWLAMAEGARRPSDFGGDGLRPDFSPDALNLPDGTTTGAGEDVRDFFEMLDDYQDSTPEQPAEGSNAEDADSSEATDNAADEADTAAENTETERTDAASPAEEEPAEESNGAEPAEETPTE